MPNAEFEAMVQQIEPHVYEARGQLLIMRAPATAEFFHAIESSWPKAVKDARWIKAANEAIARVEKRRRGE